MTDLERSLLRRIRKLNQQWSLIEPGDRVLVACSGGKDSWALLHLLDAYRTVVPFAFSLVAVNVDQGHPGFPAEVLGRHFARHGFEHHIEYQDTHSVVVENTLPGKTFCSLCSRMRRGILHALAHRLGCSKIALGHHRDDVIETALMSMMFAGQIRAMPARLDAGSASDVAVIRPLASCSERDLAEYATQVGAPIVPCNLCGSQPGAQRQRVKQLLAQLEAENPAVRDSLFASLAHVRPEFLYDPRLRGDATSSSRTLPIVDPPP